jgi:G:T-mismatch repair DNA endonuclease (very short patch repair protein)
MSDVFDPAKRSAVMARIKSRDTKPELLLRRLLTGLGARYRLHRKDLPGSPDVAMPGRRLAIFVHGCFWHGHDCAAGLPRAQGQPRLLAGQGGAQHRPRRPERGRPRPPPAGGWRRCGSAR